MSSNSKESKLSRFMKTPLRSALAKLKDLYVDSITGCSGGHFEVSAAGMAMGCAPAAMAVVPRSFSAGDPDRRELLRAASARVVNKSPASSGRGSPAPAKERLPKSRSVGFARIDEEEPCEFGVVDVCPRSKSYARIRK